MSKPEMKFNFMEWFQYKGWTLAVALLLLVFGLMNLYPFFWMMGTSVKSSKEALSNRETPVPATKYLLTEEIEQLDVMKLNKAQLTMLVKLQTDPKPFSLQDYVIHVSKPHAESKADLAGLAAGGYIKAEGENWIPAEIPEELASGLNARQWVTVKDFREAKRQNIEEREFFVPFTMYQQEYENKYSVESNVAAEELAELESLGFLSSTPLLTNNYGFMFSDPNVRLDLRFLTSVIITVAVVILEIIITSMMGYAIARLKFPFKMWFVFLLILAAIAPREAVIIPIFRFLHSLGALENLWGMVFWMGSVGIGNTFLMAGYFLTIPKEMEEAASVDGAGPFRTFFDIVLPMARPIVITVGLFAFIGAWNNFLIPLICTMSRQELQPLAVAVYSYQKANPGQYELTNTAAAVMLVPIIIMFIFLQKHVVSSISAGAVKG